MRVLLVLFAFAISGPAAEIAMRAFAREQQANGNYWGIGAFEPDDLLGYRHAAGFRGYAYREGVFDCPVEIGPNNLRQSNVAEQAAFPRRLLILGDSMAFGLGVNEEATFATLAQGRFNPEGIGVIDGSQTGYSATQEVGFGIPLAERFHPDAIILSLYPENDIQGDYYAGFRNVEVKYGYRLRKNRWLPFAPFDYLRTHSYVLKFLEGMKNRVKSKLRSFEFARLAETRRAEVMQPTLDALGELQAYSAARDIRFGVLMIPAMAGESLFDEPLRTALGEAGIPFLDLGGGRLGREDYFGGDGHCNERGHAKIAEYLIPFGMSLVADHAEPSRSGG